MEKVGDYEEGVGEGMEVGWDGVWMGIYRGEECEGVDGRWGGFVVLVEEIEVVKVESGEMVIEGVVGVDKGELEVDDVKWVMVMVLLNIGGWENG